MLERLMVDVTPVLAEEHGFRFAASRLAFTREVAPFKQEISFHLSKWNEAGHCEFWTISSVYSLVFKRWCKTHYANEHADGLVVRQEDMNFNEWKLPSDDSLRHQFFDDDQLDQQTVLVLIRNIENVAIPWMDRLSDWEAAAAWQDKREDYGWAFDLYMMAGKDEVARRYLEEKIPLFTNKRRLQDQSIYEELKIRWDTFFAETAGELPNES